MESSKIKVVFTYIAYPVAMARYMLDALKRRPDVEVWCAAPYTGRWIPWLNGMMLPENYLSPPDLEFPRNAIISYSLLSKNTPWEPDLWIEGNAGLQTIGRPAGKYIVIGTDPHVLPYDHQRHHADVFYCMQKPYMKPGDQWLPYGYDPIWHKKTTRPWPDREVDISLVGLPYPIRRQLMSTLDSLGLKTYLGNGPAYEDAWDIYNNSKLGLNWSSLKDTTARVYELMAMGVVPILNRVPDLMEMFEEDKHFLGFDSAPEAVAKVMDILGDPLKAEAIAEAAHEVIQPHSWDARMDQVLMEAGVL
jgi:hypothetical protein